MGTRSFVGIMNGDSCHAIYIHFDGYLSGVGVELQKYTSRESVEELISHGDRSSLDGPYYKDHAEKDANPTKYSSFEEFFEDATNRWVEWYYIFKDGEWYCGNTYPPSFLHRSPLYKTLTPFKQALEIYKES